MDKGVPFGPPRIGFVRGTGLLDFTAVLGRYIGKLRTSYYVLTYFTCLRFEKFENDAVLIADPCLLCGFIFATEFDPFINRRGDFDDLLVSQR